MKKQSLLLGAMCVLMFSMSACSNEEELQVGVFTEEVNEITMTATDFEYPTTRTDFEIGSSGAAFKWAKNDTVGIFPNEGSQVYFPMTSGAGTNSASFTGGGWALKSSATYAAYYPFIGDMYLNQKKIPISYTGQAQAGNGSTAHLGAYDFMAASATTAESGGVNFIFKHLGCLVQLNITVPDAGTFSSVTLTADEEVFVEKGYIDLTNTTPAIVPTKATSTLNIDLKDVTTTSANEVVTVYFMMAPVDMTGKILTVNFGDIEDKVDVKNFEGGKAYQLCTPIKASEPIAVDLGLSVKWANFNVGAESPEDCGDYFAWGETSPKSNYDYINMLILEKFQNGLKSSGVIDNNGNLTAAYDAATVNWGGNWRMPTRSEIEELLNNCTWTWTAQNGVNGYLVCSKFNGNTIFLPAAGFRQENFENAWLNAAGRYWSATVTHNFDMFAFKLYFTKNDYEEFRGCDDSIDCSFGFSVRPVTE